MVCGCTAISVRSIPHRLFPGNQRGAVFLLAVYLAALTLLLLGGVSFQRTMGEVRASQVSRDLQQAFWLSEASLDKATMRMRSEALKDQQQYPLPGEAPLMPSDIGIATFQLATTSGEVIPPQPPRPPLGQFAPPVPAAQQLTREVTATGATLNGISNHVKASIEETGPLQGIWAKGLITVNGGREHGAANIFATGNLFSDFGSVAASIPSVDVVSADPVKEKRANVLVLEGLTKAQDAHELETSVSPELMSLKNGYTVLEGTPKKVDDDAIRYQVQVGAAVGSEHINGVLAVGISDEVQDFRSRFCGGSLILREGEVRDIDDDYEQRHPHVRDLDKNPGHITLCVRAIVPEDAHGWGKVFAGQAPEIRFRQPTTLYVTGSQEFNLADTTFDITVKSRSCPLGCLTPVPGFVLPIVGVQTQWRVSVAAKISTVDRFGYTIPNGLTLIQRIKGRERMKWPGVVWIQPGHFSGSIYTPQSLVVIRARDAADQYDPSGKKEPLHIRHIVGNEVVVELDSDQLEIGTSEEDRSRQANTNVKSWTN